jgi:hypothetical protein
MRDESAEIAANQTAERHRRAILPIHIAFDYEQNYRHASQTTRQKVLQRDHVPDIAGRNEAQGADHQNANACAEIPATMLATKNKR